MKMIMQPNREVLAVLKEPQVLKNEKYRLISVCLIEDIDGGKLLFNGLTRSCIWIPYDEFENIYDEDKKDYFMLLYKLYFLVPENFDDLNTVDKVRQHFMKPIDDFYLNHPTAYTILTTTKCNARCFYCYELKSKNKRHMTEETAHKIVDYIKKHSFVNNPIKLHWFGGEPLFNAKVIDIITNGVRNAGFSFMCTFTSNAYLFDPETVIKAKSAWNTQQVQITIDGTEEIYNKTKNYIYKNVNPYKRLMNNIAALLNSKIHVSVRMNIDQHNADNLKVLVRELHTRFGNHPFLSMYCYPIFEDATFSRTEEERVLVFSKLAELEQVMDDCGFYFGETPSGTVRSAQCMADGGNHVTISPNGELGVCEHCIDYDFWGNVDSDEKDLEPLKGWKVYEERLDICKDCPLYGDCLRPTKCEEMSKCDIHYKKWKLRKNKKGLLTIYRNITNNNRNIPQQPQLLPVTPNKQDDSIKSYIKKWINKL